MARRNAVLRRLAAHVRPQPVPVASSPESEEPSAQRWGAGSTARSNAGQLAGVPYTQELPGCRDTE